MRSELSNNAWSEPVTDVRVLVADDDNGVRAHLVSLLADVKDGTAVVAGAEIGRAPPLRWIVRGRPLSQCLGCVLAM
jgi:hypothetical protein